ncbi:MAG TPA: hypothetical protein PKG88_02180 [Bacteroidales bacterium]|jgi:hypothetical protein|nr:hypothetical protein [Bacteroidales bacterium]
MHCKLNFYISIVLFFLGSISVCGQENSAQGTVQDTTNKLSPDYLPVYTAPVKQHHFYPLVFQQIDTQMVEVNHFSPTLHTDKIYQTLGIFGQAHQSVVFDFEKDMGFRYIKYPYPLLFKTQNDLLTYKLETSYTKVGYFFGLSSENSLSVDFAQKVKNAIVSINVIANSNNKDYYLNQEIRNLLGDAQVQYENKNKSYGLRASYIINRTENQENGGIRDIELFKQHNEKNNTDYPVYSNNGFLTVLTNDVNFQHFLNVKNKQGFYFGTFTHNVQYQSYRSNYFDCIDTSLANQAYFFESDSTFDTLECYKIVNSIQLSNFTPFSSISNNENFLRFAGGIMHEYFEDRRTYYNFHSFTPFIRGNLKFLDFFEVFGKFSYSFGGYTHNDAIANLKGEWTFSKKYRIVLGVHTDFYRVSPDYIYTKFTSNHFKWDTIFKKQNIASLGAYITYKDYKASAKIFLLDNVVIFGPDYKPVQLSKFSRLVQIAVYAPFRYKGFGLTTHIALQNSSSDSIQVPLLAGKANLFYIFDIFRKKLKLQIGLDVMYNTSYYANGYSPALYSFYFQNSNIVGNYWFVDASATIRISRLYAFARIGNLLAPFQQYNMFTTPGYPNKDFLLTIGINWRFHD